MFGIFSDTSQCVEVIVMISYILRLKGEAKIMPIYSTFAPPVYPDNVRS